MLDPAPEKKVNKPQETPTRRPCRLLCLFSDYRDYLHIRSSHQGDSPMELKWSASIQDALDQSAVADVVLWQPGPGDPEMGAALRILSEHMDAPVIVVGPRNRESAARKAIRLGAADYLARMEVNRTLACRTILRSWYRDQADLHKEAARGLDTLTGLPVRSLLMDRLQQALYRAEQEDYGVAIAVFNLMGFRRINQTYGFEAGDKVVKLVARRLQQVLGPTDTLARVGADEFAVVFSASGSPGPVDELGCRLLSACEEPVFLEDHVLELRAAIGLSVYPNGGEQSEQLLGNAHIALSEARQQRTGGLRVYHPSMRKTLNHTMALDSDFRKALRSDGLAVHYQPKIDILTGEVTGMEALVRWPHPTRGMLMPGDFVPAAERTGMIIPMGYWILQKTCQDLAFLQTLGFEDLLCSVNLSFRQFHDRRLSETVFRIIYNTEVDTSSFEFELTESSMMFDTEYTRRCLTELTHLGIRFALDDFGTGYSSFSTLRDLPISTVKIDKSFMDNVVDSSEDAALVSGMIDLSHQLGLTVVAEGVENEAQLEFLRKHHCDQGQGYYFAKPLPLDAFCDFLIKRRDASGVADYGVA